MDSMGVTLDATSTSFAKMLGSLMINITVLFIFARKSKNPEFKKGAIYCALVYLLIGTVILVLNQLKGLLNEMGWSLVIFHIVFFIWFGYYAIAFKNKQAE